MGRRRHLAQACLIAAVQLLLPAVPVGASVNIPTPGEPSVSAGDIRFHASAVAYRQGDTDARVEFLIRVPYREIRFVQTGDRFEARVRVTVELTKAGGRRIGYEQKEARLQSTDLDATQDSLLGEVYTMGLVAARGQYRFEVTVEDMNVARRGLIYQMKNKKRQGEVRGDIDMGDWLFGNPALSGIEFAWSVRPRSPETPFGKGEYEVLPHPSAYYGLFRDVLSAYYEIYDTTAPPEGRTYRVRSMILDAPGDTLLESIDSLRVTDGTAWQHMVRADVASLPGGHYRFRLDLLRDDDQPIATSQAEFDMLWEMDSWNSDAVNLYKIAAKTLMSQEEAYGFGDLTRGDKEAVLGKLWRAIDPTPETAENELKRMFQQRVDYVNAHYTILEKGMFSDRGHVWIQFGEPDEIQIERIPVDDRTLGVVAEGQIPKVSKDLLTRPETGIADNRPYEIWTYHLKGNEVVPRHRMNDATGGMKFVFVDEQGYGDYTLRYSSVSGLR